MSKWFNAVEYVGYVYSREGVMGGGEPGVSSKKTSNSTLRDAHFILHTKGYLVYTAHTIISRFY